MSLEHTGNCTLHFGTRLKVTVLLTFANKRKQPGVSAVYKIFKGLRLVGLKRRSSQSRYQAELREKVPPKGLIGQVGLFIRY